jgi:hypothetical protein
MTDYRNSKWAAEIIELQKDDGSWGYFHTLSNPSKRNKITTEQAIRRLEILGYTINDKPIAKVVSYMQDCLTMKKELPDRREKVHNWDIFTSLMLSTWIKKVVTSGTKAEVETAYGEVVHFPKEVVHYYFNNCKIDTLIVGMMDSVCEDKERSGITFIKDGKEELLIDSADFRNLRKPIVQDSIPTNRIDSTIVITDLLLRKPDLMGQSKWGFHLNKHIEATIADVGWLQQVHAGKIRNLYAGVKIPVKLQIDIELDETSMPIEGTEKYIVLEILGSIIEPEQQNYQLTMDNETFNKKQGD